MPLLSIPFSCEDKNECPDLYVDPYYSIVTIDFNSVAAYEYINGTPQMYVTTQDYATAVYSCENLALYFTADLDFHSQNIPRWNNFSLIPQAYALCNNPRPGYMGTQELVDRIYISSAYDFDETHPKNAMLNDIVEIFAYSKTGDNSLVSLSEFNATAPHPAPERFYLLLKQNPTKSNIQEFTVEYRMVNDGGIERRFRMKCPEFHVIVKNQ